MFFPRKTVVGLCKPAVDVANPLFSGVTGSMALDRHVSAAVVGTVILGARPAGRRPPGPEDDGVDGGHERPAFADPMQFARPAGGSAFATPRSPPRFARLLPALPLLVPIPRGSVRIAYRVVAAATR